MLVYWIPVVLLFLFTIKLMILAQNTRNKKHSVAYQDLGFLCGIFAFVPIVNAILVAAMCVLFFDKLSDRFREFVEY